MLYAEDIADISIGLTSSSQGRFNLESPLRAKLLYLFSLLGMEFESKEERAYWAQFPRRPFGFEWMHVKLRVSSTYKDIDICIDEQCIAMFNTDFSEPVPPEIDDLVSALILATKRALAYVRAGRYDEELRRSVPYELRYGQLPISLYWGLFPNKKKEFFSYLSKDTIYGFQNPTSTFELFDACPDDLSVDDFLGWLYSFYLGLGLPVQSMSPYDAYRKYGVCSMNLDVARKSVDSFFEEFYSGTACVFDDGESEVFIYPTIVRLEETRQVRYLVGVSGQVSFDMTPRFVSGYMSMLDAGAPATLEDANKYRRRLLGLGNVGVVPEYKIADMCSAQDKRFSDVDFCVNLSDVDSDVIIPYVQWLALDKPTLES